MATRAQMREITRRRLLEQSADRWDDADLNSLLNMALNRVQLGLMRIDPDRFIYKSTAPVVANDEYVELPSGFWNVKRVRFKSEAAGDWKRIKPSTMKLLTERLEGGTADPSDTHYVVLSKWILLTPTPSVSVNPGLELLWVPTLTMAADADVPDIPLLSHMAVVVQTHIYALPEVGTTQRDELVAEYRDIMNDLILAWNQGGLDEGRVLQPDIRRPGMISGGSRVQEGYDLGR